MAQLGELLAIFGARDVVVAMKHSFSGQFNMSQEYLACRY
jgi:hypothetical protein